MRNIKNALLSVIGMCLLLGQQSRAVEGTWEYSVQVSATVQTSPPQVNLSWPQDVNGTPNSYTVYRKTLDAASWGTGTTLPGSTTSYTDSNVSVGGTYEYQIVKAMPSYTGYGYIYAGINAPVTESRGKLVLVVDNTYASQLTNELAQLQQDLVGDGWTVLRHDVSRNDTPPNIKAVIQSEYNADPANVNAVFLFGHVPVAYSGDIAPDGHIPNHLGAWPADVYYGDMHGVWTDSSVNDTGADYSTNWNVPGDGKFDQSTIPGTVELMVGRVDLANLPGELVWNGPATFPNELALLRNYLNKDHAFRSGQLNLQRRGLVGDYFGIRNGEAFAASGWRNFAPFFGANNVTSLPNEGTWIPTLASSGYLWAYGCGAGSFSSIGGIGNSDSYFDGYSTEVYSNNIKAIFTLEFGSWLGDWNSQDNIMRTVLALPTYGLTCAWSGRPHWFMHHMALGLPIGYSARLTQNNGPSGLYQNQINTAAGEIHVALMGDPTLRMHPVAPPTSVAAKTNSSSISLSWTASPDSIVGYNIYRASNANGPFTRVNSSPVSGTSYTDTTANSGIYMVRAIKLETSGSGTYYNPSEGAFSTSSAAFITSTNSGSGSNSGTGSTGSTNSTGGSNTNTVGPVISTVIPGITNFVDWVDDAVPTGAQTGADGGDSWNWVSSNPTPFSGNVASQSTIASGEHQHFFDWAPNTLNVNTGDVMVAYVYLDPANPPSEIMLQWCSGSTGSWEHRAYWGANSLTYGTSGTASRYYMGALPATGQWVPLYVPASAVSLEGASVRGMCFTLYNGRATWDAAGKGIALQTSVTSTNSDPGTNSTSTNSTGPDIGGSTNTNTVVTTTSTNLTNFVDWVDDAVPTGAQTGADGGDSWNWVSSNPTPFSGNVASQSTIASGEHQHFFDWAPNTLNVNTGDVMVAYVYLDPANPPSEIMLQWCAGSTGSWEHRAYWGANSLSYGTSGTASRNYMGALPATGQWVPLYVPASSVSLEGASVRGMCFTLYNGRATWDAAGKGSLVQVVTTVTNSGGGITSTNGSGSGTNSDGGITSTNGSGSSTNSGGGITSTNGSGSSTNSGGGITSTNSGSTSNVVTTTITTNVANFVDWVDDAVPTGAQTGADGGDSWNWVSSNPTPFSGSVANQSATAPGEHQHYFDWAPKTLNVNTGDVMIAYVYLDPANPPSEIMLQWCSSTSGTWEHRAYWGANSLSYGTSGSQSRYYMGALPATGQWVPLYVPASSVGLEGASVRGMCFTLYNGRATWDAAGKGSLVQVVTTVTNTGGGITSTNTGSGSSTNSGSGITSTNTTTGLTNFVDWVDDAVPAGAQTGADGGDSWNWVSSNPTPFSGSVASQSAIASGEHQHFFDWAPNTLSVNTGDVMVAYVYLDPVNPPSEIMLQWCSTTSGTWEHRAYWGANSLSYGTSGTASRYFMGALPATGQWVPLYVPASSVGLEGASVRGMCFTLYNGRATWDAAGKGTLIQVASTGTNSDGGNGGITSTNSGGTSTNGGGGITSTNSGGSGDTNTITSTNSGGSTNVTITYTNSSPTVMNAVDDTTGRMPHVGDNGLHILSPNTLELVLINSKQPDPATVTNWNFVDASGNYYPPSANEFNVTVNGKAVAIQSIGFKRRTLYQGMLAYDLRIENSLYLQLAASIPTNATVAVSNPDTTLWPTSMQFTNTANPLRYSPAIHVNQEGYVPSFSKQAMVGYYLGSLGEMSIPASTPFTIVDATSGTAVYQGTLTSRVDSGWEYSPAPYQKVMMADFSGFTTPGEYQLVVPGYGASLPFLINDGIAMDFARAYALGLYEQRCGTNNEMPYTRFTHGPCHTAAASVPLPESSYQFTWNTIAGYSGGNSTQTAPQLVNNSSSLYPFVNTGTVDVHGGHHDAGDYSKYTINVASLTHFLCFAVDSLPGVSNLDNLGIPESGDGISDVLQECKWEADYLCRLQDADGGFYFIVYPQNREYESNVTPDHGDPQVVWPKNTACSAAATAALAQCASSPAFKAAYPQAAALYLQKAKLGWQFLTNAIAKYGKAGAYQKITFYGDDYNDNDEMAWAACQIFLATGDQTAHQDLLSWFDPSDPNTWRWGWWHMSECYGNAIRSYAFAVQSGRVQSASQLNATFLAKCQAEIAAAANDAATWSQQSAYGTSFPSATKAVNSAGWYFGDDYGFDLAVGYQLNPQASYLQAIVANMNYEGGCNPVNVTYVTGLGWKRNRTIVSQMAANDGLTLPPSGVPVGNVQAYFPSIGWPGYNGESEELCFPSDSATTAMYPFYDRWGDTWNVTTETVGLNMARAMADIGFLATLTATKSQPYVANAGQIILPTNSAPDGTITATFQPPAGMDLNGARVVWEAAYQEPAYGPTYTFTPQYSGAQYIHAEAQWPDGRRSFATNVLNYNPPFVIWVEDSLPVGATPATDGTDSWNWVNSNPTPYSGSLANQSLAASGEHQHYFTGATGTLAINKGDTMFAYIYIDPANPPTEVMLQWNDGSSWEHRAFWGANSISYGNTGTTSRYNAGALPATGKWVQLAVPASAVGLEGSTINGMSFTLYNGRATWDHAGKAAQGVTIQ